MFWLGWFSGSDTEENPKYNGNILDLQTLPLVLSHQIMKANSEFAELKGYITASKS